MNKLLPIILLALVSGACLASASSSLQNEPQRQARSVSQSSQANMIDQHGPVGKSAKAEADRKQVAEFMTPKNILKIIMKLIFGSPDEMTATSRNVMSHLSKVLEIFKSSFGHRSRSAGGRASVRDWAEEAATGGITMLQAYVKSVLTNEPECVKKYLCQASREAYNQDIGHVISAVGGYATSYLLDANKPSQIGFKALHEASTRGRTAASIEECAKLFKCNEVEP